MNYASVQLACMALFLHFPEIGKFMAVQTPPGESWKNLCERINCQMNAALQGVSFMRKEMTAEVERLIKSKSTLKDIRKLASYHDVVKDVIARALMPVEQTMAELFSQLSFHDTPLRPVTKPTHDEIAEWSRALLEIDRSINLEKILKAELESKKLCKFSSKATVSALCTIFAVVTATVRNVDFVLHFLCQ